MNMIQITEPGSRQLVVAELSTAVGKAKGIETSTLSFCLQTLGSSLFHHPRFLLAAYDTSWPLKLADAFSSVCSTP